MTDDNEWCRELDVLIREPRRSRPKSFNDPVAEGIGMALLAALADHAGHHAQAEFLRNRATSRVIQQLCRIGMDPSEAEDALAVAINRLKESSREE